MTLSMYYSGQTGRPYSYNFGTDVNGDGASTNDLLFYPRETDVTITNGTYAQVLSLPRRRGVRGLRAGHRSRRATPAARRGRTRSTSARPSTCRSAASGRSSPWTCSTC